MKHSIEEVSNLVVTALERANYVADLKADFDRPDSAVLATEFCGTSISSHVLEQERIDRALGTPAGAAMLRESIQVLLTPELSAAQRADFMRRTSAQTLSQFLHGEQGALMVASQLVSCAPTHDAKLYAASQTFDEARGDHDYRTRRSRAHRSTR